MATLCLKKARVFRPFFLNVPSFSFFNRLFLFFFTASFSHPHPPLPKHCALIFWQFLILQKWNIFTETHFWRFLNFPLIFGIGWNLFLGAVDVASFFFLLSFRTCWGYQIFKTFLNTTKHFYRLSLFIVKKIFLSDFYVSFFWIPKDKRTI